MTPTLPHVLAGGASRSPTRVSTSSASMEAMIAWIGIRPLAISCPPERRSADAKGAAQRFSQMSTPAVLFGSMAAARCSVSPAWAAPLLARHRDAQSLLARDQVVRIFCVLAEIDLLPVDGAGEDAALTVVVVADWGRSVASDV